MNLSPDSPRKLEAKLLAEYLRNNGAEACGYDAMPEGVAAAMELAGKDGVVLCFGSLSSIGDIKAALDQLKK